MDGLLACACLVLLFLCSGRSQETYYPHAPSDAVVHLEAQQQQRHGEHEQLQVAAAAAVVASSEQQQQQQLDEEPPYSFRGPYFDTSVSNNVTALVGKTAYLKCRVKNLANRTVSWVRHHDIHLLTVGRYTYTSDQRFVASHSPQTEDWTLQVRYPQLRDSGIYECQVSTTPPIGHSMYLSVVEPNTTIVGGPDMFINKGSTMNLTCIVHHSPEPPPAIYWTHNEEEINYDSPRGGVSVITEKGDVTTSYLLIQRAKEPDSGKYTCNPSNANPETVVVHVLNGEHPAAMQHGGQLRLEYPFFVVLFSFLVAVLAL
ncbi:lachesin-like [Frankliniella occidentalis]|uniref:Lachesin-like n=1 Tax=Frankliniella occidentalis TaxID=133901 RepID=A0A9C6U3X4_FRAOC|nr:lachesin-like [Frankliniella occidentalis]XP_052127078.1 lachesin-like [Frankliniella occidentalis]XP_052127119.1 lachesin-like [Frankliniella occidentalis]XP_052127165.1 lachesin-like [Frankliniella occidentalis]